MTRTLHLSPLESPESDLNSTFNVVIAYEDFDTGKHARKTYDFLVENLGQRCEFTNQMWKFEVLSVPIEVPRQHRTPGVRRPVWAAALYSVAGTLSSGNDCRPKVYRCYA